MTTEATRNGAGKVSALRTVEGPTCARCGEPTGLIQLNGKSVQVEARMVSLGDTLVFALHCCATRPEPRPQNPRRFRR